jgi:hypothetical protein
MLALPLLIMLAVPALASGQSLSTRAIEQINATELVRVRLVQGKRRTLYAPQADSDSLRYQTQKLNSRRTAVQLPRALPMADIAQIERPIGTHVVKGAIKGAVIGGAYGYLLCHANLPGGTCSAKETITGVAVVALVGAGIGALIGNGRKRWETIYQAP